MLKKFTNFVFFTFFLLIFANIAFGQGGGEPLPGGGTPTVIPLENPLGQSNIMTVVNRIIDYLIWVSIPILAIMILWGGFQILAARDNANKVKEGMNTIKWAVIGFTIILISKGVALIILKILDPTV